MPTITDDAIARLYRRAQADRWRADRALFAAAVRAGADKALPGQPSVAAVERHLESLHAADLALACACAAGDERAWEHFIAQYRPILYRSADALARGGGARDLADALYADLYGTGPSTDRRSLFRYYHGRSSLATWLRAVLSQRFVDRLRSERRTEPLDDVEKAPDERASAAPHPKRARYLSLVQRALTVVIAALASRDRLRLECYYDQQLTLAQIGRVLGEHEATVSRHLARTRRGIRQAIESYLLGEGRLTREEVAECFEVAVGDPGAIDLRRMIARKESEPERSI